MVCNPNGVASMSRQNPCRMTLVVERQFAMITLRLKEKKWVQLEEEREYAQLCIGAG